MKYDKSFTVKEWKKFNKLVPSDNSFRFRNHLIRLHENYGSGEHSVGIYESYDYWTLQEVLLSRYNITLIDHVNKWGVGVMCPTPLAEKIKSIPSKITQENFDKGMKKFDKGMAQFNKAVQTFSSGLGDGKGSSRKDRENISSIVGKSKNTTKIWSTPKKPTKRRKKRASSKWDSHERDMEKLFGKDKR